MDAVEDLTHGLKSLPQIDKVEVSSNLTLDDIISLFPDYIDAEEHILMTKVVASTGNLAPTGIVRRTEHAHIRNGAILAALLAVTVVKEASSIAFSNKGRSMIAPDMIEQIGFAFTRVCEV